MPVAVDRRRSDRRANALAPAQVFTGVAVVVDSLPLLRAGVAAELTEHGMRVAGAEAALQDALDAVGDRLDLAVLSDCDVPLEKAVAAVKNHVDGGGDPARVLVLLPRLDADELRRLLALGVEGVVQRTLSAVELRAAAERILAGQRVLAGGPMSVLAVAGLDLRPIPAAADSVEVELTAKEQEVLGHLAQRRPNREIAALMHVSPATVKTHLSNLYAKLGVSGRQEAVTAALQQGLLA